MESKWFVKSATLWGAFIAAFSTFWPVVSQFMPFDLTPDLISSLGAAGTAAIQSLGQFIGVGLTVYGRLRVDKTLVLIPSNATENVVEEVKEGE